MPRKDHEERYLHETYCGRIKFCVLYDSFHYARNLENAKQLENAKRAFQAQTIANREAFAGSVGRAMTGLAQLAGQYAGSTRGVSINRGDTVGLLEKYKVDDDIINNLGLIDQKGMEQIVLDSNVDKSAKERENILKQFRLDLQGLRR